jgi:hypothetical protein
VQKTNIQTARHLLVWIVLWGLTTTKNWVPLPVQSVQRERPVLVVSVVPKVNIGVLWMLPPFVLIACPVNIPTKQVNPFAWIVISGNFNLTTGKHLALAVKRGFTKQKKHPQNHAIDVKTKRKWQMSKNRVVSNATWTQMLQLSHFKK